LLEAVKPSVSLPETWQEGVPQVSWQRNFCRWNDFTSASYVLTLF